MEEQEKCPCGRDLADCECQRKPRTYTQDEVNGEILYKITWMAFGLEDDSTTIQDLREFVFNEFMCQYALMPLRRQHELPAIVEFAKEVEAEGTHGLADFPVWLANMIAARTRQP